MANIFKENFIKIDGSNVSYHEFEKNLFEKKYNGNETICSKILTDNKDKLLNETRLWTVVLKLLEELKEHTEFSERLKEEIKSIIEGIEY